MIRQGDVLFVPVPDAGITEHSTKVESGVIQEGSATGHHHRIAESDLEKATLYMIDWRGERALRCTQAVSITHEEHKTVTLPPGDYKIRIAQEYDYLQNVARSVRD